MHFATDLSLYSRLHSIETRERLIEIVVKYCMKSDGFKHSHTWCMKRDWLRDVRRLKDKIQGLQL